MGVFLHNFKMLLQPAVSWLSTMPVFQYCILSYYELTGNLETHGSCGVKTLHFGVEVAIPSTILDHSALLICHSLPLQEMLSLLTQQDPPCWGKFSREEKAALTWHWQWTCLLIPELIIHSCRALLRWSQLLLNSDKARIRSHIWAQHGAHWNSYWKTFVFLWLAQIALLFQENKKCKILVAIMCYLKIPETFRAAKRGKVKCYKMLNCASRDQLIKKTEKLNHKQTVTVVLLMWVCQRFPSYCLTFVLSLEIWRFYLHKLWSNPEKQCKAAPS